MNAAYRGTKTCPKIRYYITWGLDKLFNCKQLNMLFIISNSLIGEWEFIATIFFYNDTCTMVSNITDE